MAIGIIFLGLLGPAILGFIVFGGGQVFMPLFQALWTMMGVDIDKIMSIFATANATPGVVSTKLGYFTGFLMLPDGSPWGWVLSVVTYLVFAIPSCIIVWHAVKLMKKSSESNVMGKLMLWLRPVIIGILISLVVQLFISIAFPNVLFNAYGEKYFGLKEITEASKGEFFSGWRKILLIVWSIFVPIEVVLLKRKNVPSFTIVISHIIIGIFIFLPFLPLL